VFTGQPHVLDGVTRDSFEVDEADGMADVLNLHDMKTRGILKFP